MYTRVSAYRQHPTFPTTLTATTSTTSTKELTMRINPSDILFAILSIALLLAAAFVLGGLAAHPF